jgi:2-polyprenyl-3-methyl-5-hydroxy-6-metoxy-1,4-benzoquinol methylase
MVKAYSNKQIGLLLPYLRSTSRILDFGCGDLSLLMGLHTALPEATLMGIDVVDTGVRGKGITYTTYDGKTIPYKDNSFDVTIVYHVFHHCDNPKEVLQEVMRVTKTTILMVEPVYRNRLDIFFMKILDRLGNGWRNVSIAMPFAFQKESTWKKWVNDRGWNIQLIKPAGVLPGWLPFGETKLFVLTSAE